MADKAESTSTGQSPSSTKAGTRKSTRKASKPRKSAPKKSRQSKTSTSRARTKTPRQSAATPASTVDEKAKPLGPKQQAHPSDSSASPPETDGGNNTRGTVVPAELDETVERPEMLLGSTYKIKTPLSDHALYVTINDVILEPGSEREVRRPFEIFINSKNMDHFQWIVALTRIISAVFRKGGDITFLVEELHSVFDPQGGYIKPRSRGKFVPSLVSEIGDVIQTHLALLGMIPEARLDEELRAYCAEKRAEFEAAQRTMTAASEAGT